MRGKIKTSRYATKAFEMMNLLKLLYPLRLAPVSSDTDKAVEILCRELPFVIHEYPSCSEFNGWVVPYKWDVQKAQIRKNGKLIYNGMAHPLGVIGYSQSYYGKMELEELKKHLFHHPRLPDALVYHCDLYYKVGKKDWGFCAPSRFIQSLKTGTYDVELQTTFKSGTLKICDYLLPGKSASTILFNAHNCHAGQANDDISGVVIGVELMKRLSRKENHFSYRLIVCPEHLGTVFYLSSLPKETIKSFTYCLFLEMLGNNNRLAFQESFFGDSILDRAAHKYLHHARPDYYSDKFRKIVGNDETVWEAPGYEIPTISLSRFPYPEYHSSEDTHEIIQENTLSDSVEAVLGIVNILESNCTMRRRFDGLIALSNPKYNLYIHQADPSIRPTIKEDQTKWNYLMDCLPRYFNGNYTVLDIAEKHELPYDEVYEYLLKFEKKELIKLEKVDT